MRVRGNRRLGSGSPTLPAWAGSPFRRGQAPVDLVLRASGSRPLPAGGHRKRSRSHGNDRGFRGSQGGEGQLTGAEGLLRRAARARVRPHGRPVGSQPGGPIESPTGSWETRACESTWFSRQRSRYGPRLPRPASPALAAGLSRLGSCSLAHRRPPQAAPTWGERLRRSRPDQPAPTCGPTSWSCGCRSSWRAPRSCRCPPSTQQPCA
jgi:hypothetical protein